MNIDLITPSYAPDFERCRLLCESVETYVTGYQRHFLIVDEKDASLFRQLESERCQVIVKEDILPHWLHRLPWSTRWWFSERTLPVRGWILQQIVKLSVSEWNTSEVFMFIDSDVFFIRPFDAGTTSSNNSVRLYRGIKKQVDRDNKRHNNWSCAASNLLSLESHSHFNYDYISQMNTWRRDVLIQLQDRIETGSEKSWKQVLCNKLDFSEYVLYGAFVDSLLGVDSANHYVDSVEICNCSWHYELRNELDFHNFVKTTQPTQSAVLLQSNLQKNPTLYSGEVDYVKRTKSESFSNDVIPI